MSLQAGEDAMFSWQDYRAERRKSEKDERRKKMQCNVHKKKKRRSTKASFADEPHDHDGSVSYLDFSGRTEPTLAESESSLGSLSEEAPVVEYELSFVVEESENNKPIQELETKLKETEFKLKETETKSSKVEELETKLKEAETKLQQAETKVAEAEAEAAEKEKEVQKNRTVLQKNRTVLRETIKKLFAKRERPLQRLSFPPVSPLRGIEPKQQRRSLPPGSRVPSDSGRDATTGNASSSRGMGEAEQDDNGVCLDRVGSAKTWAPRRNSASNQPANKRLSLSGRKPRHDKVDSAFKKILKEKKKKPRSRVCLNLSQPIEAATGESASIDKEIPEEKPRGKASIEAAVVESDSTDKDVPKNKLHGKDSFSSSQQADAVNKEPVSSPELGADGSSEEPCFRVTDLQEDYVLDHVVLAAADIDSAIREFQDKTGVKPVKTGHINGLGITKARVAFQGSSFLEIIAPDSERPGPIGTLVQSAEVTGLVPFHWAIRMSGAEALSHKAARLGYTPDFIGMKGPKKDGTIGGWEELYLYGHEVGGVCPFFINWDTFDHPCESIPVLGHLIDVEVRAPNDDKVHQLIAQTKSSGFTLEEGECRFELKFDCPKGEVSFSTDQMTGFRIPGLEEASAKKNEEKEPPVTNTRDEESQQQQRPKSTKGGSKSTKADKKLHASTTKKSQGGPSDTSKGKGESSLIDLPTTVDEVPIVDFERKEWESDLLMFPVS